jgi:deoxyribose-phosphate aldolase
MIGIEPTGGAMAAQGSDVESEMRNLVARVLDGLLGGEPVSEPANAPAQTQGDAATMIAIGSDHGGFELDQATRAKLIDLIANEVLTVLAHQVDRGDTEESMPHVADRVALPGEASHMPVDLAKYIDHTALKPETSRDDIDQLCQDAARYQFASVCVNPAWVERCSANLSGSGVKVCTVIGFPLGANTTEIKALEARRAIRDGAREVDMVINVGALKSGDHATVLTDIEKVVDVAHQDGAIVKVILETSLLTDEEKVIASSLAKQATADFVKTSTGFGGGGATVHDVALMREAVGPEMGVKASGGIRTRSDVEDMIAAGATRIGASAGVQIVSEDQGEPGGDRS